MKLITHQQIRDALKYQLRLIKPNRVWLFDSDYCALSEDEFDDLVKEIEPVNMQFKVELFDCEDFAHVTSAFIKLKAAVKYPKGVAFGEITTRHLITKEIHTLNFVCFEDGTVRYYEPQGQVFIDNGASYYEPFYARI